METDTLIVLNGFFKLPNLQKLQVVNTINDYFDATDEREAIRADIENKFAALGIVENGVECKCCGRK